MNTTLLKRSFNILCLLTAGSLLIAGCGQHGQGSASGGQGGAGGKGSQPPATTVNVAPVKTGTISQVVPVVGNLQTLFTVNLSPKTAGRLVNVFVREGDPVKKGQIVAQIDPTNAQAVVGQDQANVLSAQAKVGQAQAQYQQAEVAAQVGIRNAKAAVASAKATLQKTIAGDQPQQKQQVYDQYQQQQANYQNALNAYNREQQLYKQGAVALADLQNSETTYNVQKSLLDSYKQAWALAQQGGRPEDIQAARQTLVQQEQNLQNAYANRANVAVNKQAVIAAQAGVAQARAALTSAEKDLADTNIVSPIDGVVSQRNVDPGAIAQPGTAVLQVVDLHTMFYQPTVSETQFSQITVGQSVTINVDAFPGRTFYGKVTQIYPAASTTDRQFSVRVSIPNTTQELRPGMYARGSITTRTDRNVIIIPVSSMLPRAVATGYAANSTSTGIATGGTTLPPQMVFVAGSDNKAHEHDITVGIVSGSQAEVTSGLNVGDQLIVVGQGELQDGAPIKIIGPGGAHGGGQGNGGHHHRNSSAPA